MSESQTEQQTTLQNLSENQMRMVGRLIHAVIRIIIFVAIVIVIPMREQGRIASATATASAALAQNMTATASVRMTQTAAIQATAAQSLITTRHRLFDGTNADWQERYPDGFVHMFEDEVAMVFVPAGCFTMGSTDPQIDYFLVLTVERPAEYYDDETPSTRVCFGAPFWLDLYEVTQGDFARLAGQVGSDNAFTGERRPRENITWFEARTFCALRGGYLPTEAQWEYAARGPDSLTYPWGNQFISRNTVYANNSGGQTAVVSSIEAGRSWVGAYDMSGNVLEWTSSVYRQYPYPTDASGFVLDDASDDENISDFRTARGGSWGNSLFDLHAASRVGFSPETSSAGIGFRCARDAY